MGTSQLVRMCQIMTLLFLYCQIVSCLQDIRLIAANIILDEISFIFSSKIKGAGYIAIGSGFKGLFKIYTSLSEAQFAISHYYRK